MFLGQMYTIVGEYQKADIIGQKWFKFINRPDVVKMIQEGDEELRKQNPSLFDMIALTNEGKALIDKFGSTKNPELLTQAEAKFDRALRLKVDVHDKQDEFLLNRFTMNCIAGLKIAAEKQGDMVRVEKLILLTLKFSFILPVEKALFLGDLGHLYLQQGRKNKAKEAFEELLEFQKIHFKDQDSELEKTRKLIAQASD